MPLKLITPPEKELLDLATVKNHLRVDFNDDDSLIQPLITTAREYCETETKRALAPTVFEYTLDAFPCGSIRLPRPPLVSVDSVIYKDIDGVPTTMAVDSYIVDSDDEPGKIVPVGGQWPSFDPYPVNAIRIQYTAGYDATNLPKLIQQAMLLLIAHLYENREAVTVTNSRNSVAKLPMGVESLLWPKRVWMA